MSGNNGCDEGYEEEETVKDGTNRDVTFRLKRPGRLCVVDNQSPREVRIGWSGNVDEVASQGARGKSIKYAIAIDIAVGVVVAIENIELNGRGPPIHNVRLQLPLSGTVLLQSHGNVRIGVYNSSSRAHGLCLI